MAPRSRLGLYMYAPRVGGAERYLKDLFDGLIAAGRDVRLLYISWPAFDRFVGADGTDVFVPAPTVELGVAKSTTDDVVTGTPHGAGVAPTFLRRATNSVPLGAKLAPTVRSASRGAYVLENRRRLRAHPVMRDLDLLHVVNGGYPGATSAQGAMLAAADAHIPAKVMTVCSTAMPRAFPTSIDRAIDRAVDRACDAVITCGREPTRAMMERREFRHAHHEEIPWGVAPPAAAPDRRAARAELGLTAEDTVIGTLANFTGAKGHRVLLDSFVELRPRHPRLRLVLAGVGPERDSLIARAAELKVADQVVFPGNVADPFALAAALDVFVLASDIEGLPYAVLEAMSQHRPIVATDVGAMGEAVQEGVNGCLVAARDQSGLSRALHPLIVDRDLRDRYGRASRRLFDQHYHVDRMLESHLNLYDRLLAP